MRLALKLLRSVATKTPQHATKLLRIAEDLDTRWFRVKERKYKWGYRYARRGANNRIALFDGRHATHIVTKEEAANRVKSLRNPDNTLQYLPEAEQKQVSKDWDWSVNT